jgi:hypothetical protein
VNAALFFLMCVGILFALVGIFVSPGLMYAGLIILTPSFCGLVARHINPEGHK